MPNPLRYFKIFIFIGLFTVVFGAGVWVGQAGKAPLEPSSLDFSTLFSGEEEVDFTLIENVWKIIHERYVGADELDDSKLIMGAVRGMVAALDDPYSTFFTKEETKDFLESVGGTFEGVGIEIAIRDDQLIVVSPLKGTPAFRAGARAGDKILKIDGESTAGISIEGAVSSIRGKKGTTVVLTVQHLGSDEEVDLHIVRDRIEVPSVELEFLNGNIAHIELSSFNETTVNEFSVIAQKILNSNADRIILDVRNNPGGFLEVSVDIAGWFLPKGTLVVTEEVGDGSRREHRTSNHATLQGLPVVLLVNEGSASAAEILAGALRDHRRVPVIGATTFGKGSVQIFEDLPGGTSVKLTIARWLTPSGAHIQEVGIEPTITIETNPEELGQDIDKQLDKAIEVVRGL